MFPEVPGHRLTEVSTLNRTHRYPPPGRPSITSLPRPQRTIGPPAIASSIVLDPGTLHSRPFESPQCPMFSTYSHYAMGTLWTMRECIPPIAPHPWFHGVSADPVLHTNPPFTCHPWLRYYLRPTVGIRVA